MAIVSKRAALVTGGGGGIGRIVACRLAAQGWTVAVQSEDSAAEATVAAIRRTHGLAEALRASLRHETDAAGLVAAAETAAGPLRLLVHADTQHADDDLETADRDGWDRHFGSNVRAPLLLARDFARRLPDGEVGDLVAIMDRRPAAPTRLTAGLSEAALSTLLRVLAQGLAPRVRVNGIGLQAPIPAADQEAGPFAAEVCRTLDFILATPSMTGQVLDLVPGD